MDERDFTACWEANAETWTRQSRSGYDVYRDALNTPAFLSMLPPVRGLAGLDVGCGEGTNTRLVARLGAAMTGIDHAAVFIRHAVELERSDPLGVRFMRGDALALPFPDAAFDFVTSFMALMDVADPGRALTEIARVLKPDGFVQFSILNPCFVPPHRKVMRDADGNAYAVELAEYFRTGHHEGVWWFGAAGEEERKTTPPFTVPYTHLTLSMWLDCLRDAGLVLEKFGEPSASDVVAARVPEVADSQILPLFLHVRARR